MGQLYDDRPDNINSPEPGATENLKALAQELERLKRNVIQEFSQDIEQLQAQKAQLQRETEQLELKRQQQLDQQQQLAKRIAPAIAERLQELLRQQIDYNATARGSNAQSASQLNEYNENAYRAISSLDSTLRTTFRTLQQDLSSYQSSLSQQLGQMYNLEQQGAAILETLVSRLKDELEAKITESAPPPPPPVRPPAPQPNRPQRQPRVDPVESWEQKQPIPPPPPPPPPLPKPAPRKPKASQVQLGFVLILIYSVALSLQNVVTRVIVKPQPSDIFGGIWNLGAYISPSLGNSVLLLLFRMVIVVAVMAFMASFLYPRTWSDVRKFSRSGDRDLWLKVIGSGFFLFLSQVLIYIAFGNLSAGVALTIFFIFPIVTVLLSWIFFGERPSPIRLLATAAVFFGVVLIALAGGGTVNISVLGIATAVGAGVTFAFYVLLIQAGAKAVHPIPLSLINFASILVFSLVSLMFPFISSSVNVAPEMRTEIFWSALVLGGLSLLSYLVNNIGISLIGAARASIFGATGPMFTALLAVLIIGEGLKFQELIGMLIVTAGVAAVSAERLLVKPKPKK